MLEGEPLYHLLSCSLATVLTKENAFIVPGGYETILITKPEVGDWLGYLRVDGKI
jgi:hypothetical protein